MGGGGVSASVTYWQEISVLNSLTVVGIVSDEFLDSSQNWLPLSGKWWKLCVGAQWLTQILITLWAFIFHCLLFLGHCKCICGQAEEGWSVCKGGAQRWRCLSFPLHGFHCTSTPQCPEKGKAHKLWLTWLVLRHLDLSIGDLEFKWAPFFRRNSLEECVDVSET